MNLVIEESKNGITSMLISAAFESTNTRCGGNWFLILLLWVTVASAVVVPIENIFVDSLSI